MSIWCSLMGSTYGLTQPILAPNKLFIATTERGASQLIVYAESCVNGWNYLNIPWILQELQLCHYMNTPTIHFTASLPHDSLSLSLSTHFLWFFRLGNMTCWQLPKMGNDRPTTFEDGWRQSDMCNEGNSLPRWQAPELVDDFGSVLYYLWSLCYRFGFDDFGSQPPNRFQFWFVLCFLRWWLLICSNLWKNPIHNLGFL